MGRELWVVVVRDLWDPIWPNLAASVIWGLPAFVIHHKRVLKKIEKIVGEGRK